MAIELVVIIFLILANGLLSLSEMAIVASRRARLQRNDVLCPELVCLRQVLVGDRLAHQQCRDVRRVAVPRIEGHRRLLGIRAAQEDQLRRGLRERVAEARDVADPRAVDRMPRIAERTVDDFHRVLLTGQDDQRNRTGLGQGQSPGSRRFAAATFAETPRTITNGPRP